MESSALKSYILYEYTGDGNFAFEIDYCINIHVMEI